MAKGPAALAGHARRADHVYGRSEAVKRFEAAYQPELVGGPVVFTDHQLVATNGGTTR